ncbi:hypothetical protein QAD02_019406 [Eretmocerus hayati]|uniref:Uncharacterized protein n=1 Tax=Eretmocerus hayati TaxID=131215 RepID=A0ACC2PM00_9HYME|nr:hypothetical protein QAD02_019406 [Eretmocerus hayati]
MACFLVAFEVFPVQSTASPAKGEKYSNQYDNIDVDKILENVRLRTQYHKCLLRTGPCNTNDMKYFRDNISEAVATNCKKCTPKQVQNLQKLKTWYLQHEPEQWKLLEDTSNREFQKKKQRK